METEPKIIFHNIPHVSQKCKWDCGIACVAMIVAYKSGSVQLNFYEIIHKLQKGSPGNDGFGCRPWTIDLCNILHHINIKYKYFTSFPGVNATLQKLRYYSDSLTKDNHRVNKLFHHSCLSKTVVQVRLDKEELITNLEVGPLIVLVDGNKLQCTICKRATNWTTKVWPKKSFKGHYIVLVGYNNNKNTLHYRNPTLINKICETTVENFDSARHCLGTDEDIISVQKQ